MARKDLLKGLMDQNAETQNAPASPAPQQRPASGAIGAVSASIAELKSRALTDVDPTLIDDGGFKDRLDHQELDDLQQSIAEYGQQVPVLLRPHPKDEGRYQIVYGRRRVAALKALGKPVKAMVRSLSDQMLILAQGQENSARKDLTFIEKANFARQMRDGGYDRKTICDALHLDKTVISRMLQVVDGIPIELIEAIGSAPSVGRDRWLALVDKIDGKDRTSLAKGDTSDQRFEAVFNALVRAKPAAKPKAKPDTSPIVSATGGTLGHLRRKGKRSELTIESQEFADFVADNLPRLFKDWRDKAGR